MNGNSSINGNGYHDSSPNSTNTDLTLQKKLSFGNSSASDQSSNNVSSRNPSKQGNMTTNGKMNSSEENADENRDAVTKRYDIFSAEVSGTCFMQILQAYF